MKMLKAVIVDDEHMARVKMQAILKENCPDVEVLGLAEDIPSAVRLITKTSPDIVFLDIEMPGYSGLQLLEFFDEDNISCQIVFTTAYNQYAIDAFKLSAIDYLLKPIQITQVVSAVEKAQKHLQGDEQYQEKITALQENMNPRTELSKIALPLSNGLLFIQVNDIMYIKGEGAYSEVVLTDGKKHLVSRLVRDFEKMLPNSVFFRPHRSYLINSSRIQSYLNESGGTIVMENDEYIPVSRDKKIDLKKVFENFKV